MLENVIATHKLEILDGVWGVFAQLRSRNRTHGRLSEEPDTQRTELSQTIDVTTRGVHRTPTTTVGALPVGVGTRNPAKTEESHR